MVHPPPADEIRRLMVVAREMFDSGEESGYLVDVATAQHEAFGKSGRPASALEREIFLDAVRRVASREEFGLESPNGGLELLAYGGGRLRRYRVKRGMRTPTGEYRFLCGLGSSLLTSEPDTLFPEDRWILGYIGNDDHTLEEVIAAPVMGAEGAGPMKLILGTVIHLSDAPPPKGFTSTDEDLDGFDDDDEAGEAGIA